MVFGTRSAVKRRFKTDDAFVSVHVTRLPGLVLLFPLLVFLFLNEFRKRDTIGL